MFKYFMIIRRPFWAAEKDKREYKFYFLPKCTKIQEICKWKNIIVDVIELFAVDNRRSELVFIPLFNTWISLSFNMQPLTRDPYACTSRIKNDPFERYHWVISESVIPCQRLWSTLKYSNYYWINRVSGKWIKVFRSCPRERKLL